MCLVTKQQKPIITTEDMVVWKMCYVYDNSVRGVYFTTFSYSPGVLNETTIVNMRENSFSDSEARHTMENTVKSIDYALECGELKSFGPGFHFATTKKRIEDARYKICKFIVPAGSEVYFDESGLGVSNKIMYSPEI